MNQVAIIRGKQQLVDAVTMGTRYIYRCQPVFFGAWGFAGTFHRHSRGFEAFNAKKI